MKRKNESGQALLLVLLSLSVVLTLILFILSRSIVDVAVSSKQGESIRAFSAAEAGVERALVTGASYSNVPIGNATYSTTVTGLSAGVSEFAYPFMLPSGEYATVWFMAHDSNGDLTLTGSYTGNNMKVCWGNPGMPADDNNTPAVEVSLYYESTPGDISTTKIVRVALDPNSSRRASNSFDAPGGTCQIGATRYFPFNKSISFGPLGINTNGLLFARIKMLYNNTPQGFGMSVNSGTIPDQATMIDSRGVAGSSNRRIIVYRGRSEFPFGSNSIISPSGITK